jgi:hypothetical protein
LLNACGATGDVQPGISFKSEFLDDEIRVVIRDRKRGGIGLDDIYDVKTGGGKFEAVTNGKTVIQITAWAQTVVATGNYSSRF